MSSTEMRRAEGWLIRFGQRDFEGDIFTAETDFFLGASGRKSSIPILFEHGQDELLQLALLGEGTVIHKDGGLWMDAVLRVPPVLGSALKRLTRDRLLGWSSGAAGHTVTPRERGNGRVIKSWGIAEASLTTRPAMHLVHSHAMIKRLDPQQYATELQARLVLSRYERIAKEIGGNHVAI